MLTELDRITLMSAIVYSGKEVTIEEAVDIAFRLVEEGRRVMRTGTAGYGSSAYIPGSKG